MVKSFLDFRDPLFLEGKLLRQDLGLVGKVLLALVVRVKSGGYGLHLRA